MSGTMSRMLETSARLLRLLSLLQSRRDWRGAELAGRLGVGLRTVRRDVDRLRDLGDPGGASPGRAGGYRLGTGGAALPPLLLDDEEAVAVAISLHSATTGSVAGLEETALRALTKLQAMLPSRLRHKITAFHATTLPLAGSSPGTVDPELLTSIAAACRDQRQLRLRYQGRDGATTRNVEPHRLVHTTHRWYLLAWDTDRGDRRTFLLDRIQGPLGPPGAPLPPPGPHPHPRPARGGRRAFVPRGRPAGSHRPARLRAAYRVELARRTRSLHRHQGLRLPSPRPARAHPRPARPGQAAPPGRRRLLTRPGPRRLVVRPVPAHGGRGDDGPEQERTAAHSQCHVQPGHEPHRPADQRAAPGHAEGPPERPGGRDQPAPPPA